MSAPSFQNKIDSKLLPLIHQWLQPYRVDIRFTRARQTKHGDFRPGLHGRSSVITLNQDLSPLQCLLTLTHEIAHLMVWTKYGRRAAPHGRAWKTCFGELLTNLSRQDCLPTAFRHAISQHASRPKASSARDLNLMAVIRDLEAQETIWLSDLSLGEQFRFRGEVFVKLKDNRTRCKCRHVGNQTLYHVSKTAPVERIVQTLDRQNAPL